MDIIGPFNTCLTKQTRNTKGFKVWVLVIIDMFSSAINMEVMKDYSSEGLVLALSNHTSRFKKPEIVTHDAGTQLVKIAKDTNKCEEEEDITKTSRKVFKDCKFIPCPTESQWHNSKVESNIKQIKMMIKSYFGKVKKQILPICNLFERIALFNRITEILNDRPICSESIDGEEFVLCPNDFIKMSFTTTALQKPPIRSKEARK